MTPAIWRETYRSMRRERRNHPKTEVILVCFLHNGMPFAARLTKDGLTIQPRVIVDRPPRARIAEELRWARHYRLAAIRDRGNPLEWIHKHAARACLGAVLTIFAHRFHSLP